MTETTAASSGRFVPTIIPKGLLVLLGMLIGLGFFFMPNHLLTFSQFCKTVGLYFFGIPALFALTSMVINRFFAGNIMLINTLTLGWLMSVMVIFWQMGSYS